MSDKIIRPETGFSNLDKAAQKRTPPPGQAFPEDKCLLVTAALAGKNFYVAGGAIFPDEIPPFSFLVPVAYSEVMMDGKLVSIQKHESLRIVGLGVVLEIINPPSWREKRDQGAI